MSEQERKFYGRRQSRPLNQSRKEALETLLPLLQLDATRAVSPEQLFPAAKERWLEIGFGSGEHVSGLMRQHPDHAYIGCEPFINGMAAFLKDIHENPPENGYGHIRVFMDDAMMIVRQIDDASLDGMFVLNPDPWHKKRHHKRRIVNAENLDEFARILKPGGKLVMSTDVPYLAEWMLTHAFNHPAFAWTATCAGDWRNAPEGWVHTKYETKGAKGAQKMVYLDFTRK